MLLVVFGPFTLVTEHGNDDVSSASLSDLQVSSLSARLSVDLRA